MSTNNLFRKLETKDCLLQDSDRRILPPRTSINQPSRPQRKNDTPVLAPGYESFQKQRLTYSEAKDIPSLRADPGIA